jgi:hypothetical protein
VGVRYCAEMCSAFQTDCNVTEVGKCLEIAAGPAAKIQYRKRWFALDAL